MTTDERLTRLENVVVKLADKSDRLDAVMLTLAEAQITLTNRVDTLTQRMDTMAVRLETVAQQSADGDRRLGERIESLVSAIGEFIRNRPATG
jgi:chaperonin cofactor prefoldin